MKAIVKHRQLILAVLVLLLGFLAGGCFWWWRPASDPATGTVTGRVIDEDGQALAGVQVTVAGTDAVFVTGEDGRFTATGITAGTRTTNAATKQ